MHTFDSNPVAGIKIDHIFVSQSNAHSRLWLPEMNQTMQWWKNAVYLIEIVMLADKNSLISDKSKTMDEIQNRYTTCV